MESIQIGTEIVGKALLFIMIKEMEETEKQILKEMKKIRVTGGKASEVYTNVIIRR